MDRSFAQQAVDELRSAGIACYFAGERAMDPVSEDAPDEETSGDSPTPPGASVRTYPIYVDRDEDYQRASDILIKLGATKELMLKDTTIAAITRWSIIFAVVFTIVIVLLVLQGRR